MKNNRFTPDIIEEYFATDGRMARLLPGYKYRREQVILAKSIANSFLNREFLLSEAGTGVGKTYAYLLPAILWTQESNEKVVISTRTKALQQQLTEKDIPALKKVLDIDFVVTEAKGRENYLCWNKYMRILAGRKRLEQGEQKFIEAILRWAEETKTGDRKELALDSALMSYWKIVAADRKSCWRDNCPYHDKCFRLKMLKGLEKADLIVTNHALLLSDMLMVNTILPQYSYLIIDEAHTFDRLAFTHLSLRFSPAEIMETLQMLYTREKGVEKGHLPTLQDRYPNLAAACTEAVELVKRNLNILAKYFAALSQSTTIKNYSYARVIEKPDGESRWFIDAVNLYQDWKETINLLLLKLTELIEEIKDTEEGNELAMLHHNLDEYSNTACLIMEEHLNQDDKITWMEYERGQVVAVASSSLNAGNILNDCLYGRLESLIMVSATLAIEGRFDYFLSRTGLDFLLEEDRVITLLQHSPFNYEEQAKMLIVNDIPEPSEPDYSETIAGVLEELFLAVGGQVLVLFTSRAQMKEIAALLRPDCDQNGFNLLVQYEDGEFNHLIDEFIHSPKAILMGVETFWEGIDLKGEVLKCVVIVRLPFRSPSDPYSIAAERLCRLERKNGFRHFMLPDATVRFKQGIGRLIRSEKDRGMVVVFDSRLERKTYGQVFKNSIPIKNVHILSRKELTPNIKAFLAK